MAGETMTMAKARAEAAKATQLLLEGLERLPRNPLKVGAFDGDGHVITEERLAQLRQVIDEAGLQALSSKHTFV